MHDTAPPPAGQRYPQMARQLGDTHQRPTRRRDRRCRPRDIPAGDRRNRTWYDRMLHMRGPADKAALAVIVVLLDAAGDALTEFTMSQEQVGERLRARHPDAPLWGTGPATVRRGTRILEEQGFLSVEDVPIPGREGLHTLRYRFHVPAHATDAWDKVTGNAEKRRKARSAEARAQRAERDRQNRIAPPAGPATPPPIGEGPAPAELDDPDTRRSPGEDKAGHTAAVLAKRGYSLADILGLLKREWAPGTPEYEAGELAARFWCARAERGLSLRGARDGP